MQQLEQGVVLPDDTEEGRCLSTILESATFRKCPVLRTLLAYLWKNRDQVSEYAIGCEALGRAASFDPKIDATVRVLISRLRGKLREFYENEGAQSRVRFFVPLGGHQLEWELVAGQDQLATLPEAATVVLQHRSALWPWVAASGILFLACIILVIQNRQATARSLAFGPEPLPPVWRNFFANGKPTNLFVPTPVFVEWGTNLRVRDVKVNEFLHLGDSPEIVALSRQLGHPRLLQGYTVASDTFAAIKLAQYLEARRTHVAVVGTGGLSVDSFGDHNTILLGVPGTSSQVQEVMAVTNFYLPLARYEVVKNRAPRPGEASEYPASSSRQHRVSPGVVALLPGRTASTRILVMAGISTAGLISFLTTPNSLAALERSLSKERYPEFFEVVVNSEMEGETVLKTWPIVARPVPASLWK